MKNETVLWVKKAEADLGGARELFIRSEIRRPLGLHP
jgi:hypothetical protein